MTAAPRALPFITPMHRGQLPACSCRHLPVDGPHRQSGRTASPERNTPSTIMSPIQAQPGSRTEIRLGVRAHTNPHHQPTPRAPGETRPTHSRPARLDTENLHR
jgi:hypothetical protein